MYGVSPENIIISGFPLPKENIGADKNILISDLARRVVELDPNEKYREHYQALLKGAIKAKPKNVVSPLILTYAVGGAGAQKETGALILDRLAPAIREGKVGLNLIAGNRDDVKKYFEEAIKESGLKINQGVKIIYDSDKIKSFRKFNDCLHDTDILWTKPSELSFYCALGLPIIMSSPVGSQEDFNREWLISVGAGVDSLDPEYVAQWLTDLLASGRLARAAVDGFLNAEQMGTYNIEKLIEKK